MAFARLMNTNYITHRLAALVVTTTLVAETHAQTSQLVYSQNFNSAANDTTGTGLNDGYNMVDNSASFNAKVFSSTQWGSGVTSDGQAWKALWLTPMQTGIIGNFYTPVVNQGQSVSAFSANFTLLNNYINRISEPVADGFSVNFGKFNNTTSAYGGEAGMHSSSDGKTGDVLSLAFYTYSGGDPRIELRYNGNTIATNAMDPFYNTQNPPPSSAFLPVNFSWDANGVDVTYAGTTVFSNVAVAGFTPGVNDSFAMAARTGAAYQNTFVDDIAINTTVAPFVWSAGAGNWTTAGGWTIGTAPTTNNNWIVMSGAGGNANNNAVTAVQCLTFASNATGSYALSGNAMTVGAEGIVNNSSSAQSVSSDLTLGASQTFNAANAALSFGGTINAGNNTLSVSGGNAVTINGAISGAGASLAKSGSGNLTLGGTNTYTGATSVNAGTLIVNGNISSSATTVSSGATLGGSGTLGAVTVAAGATLAPGNSPGTLNTATLTLDDASVLSFELNPTNETVGSNINDLVSVTGNLTLDGILNVVATSGDFLATEGMVWRLFNYTGTLTNNLVSLGSMPTLSGGNYWHLDTVTAGEVKLMVIPEPTVVTLGGLGALFLLRRRRA